MDERAALQPIVLEFVRRIGRADATSYGDMYLKRGHGYDFEVRQVKENRADIRSAADFIESNRPGLTKVYGDGIGFLATCFRCRLAAIDSWQAGDVAASAENWKAANAWWNKAADDIQRREGLFLPRRPTI